ncbi:MAG: PH domain-containing protein [Bacteroidetes bacterium]|nr:PH domain-containing protein [Bacteroidota bacterium]
MKPSEPVAAERLEMAGARRLHPLTLVQRLIMSLPGFVFILLPMFGDRDSSAWVNLIIAGLYALFILPWIALYYIRFRYWVTPSELIVHSGVVTRRNRNIPIDRIQNIEIEQGLLQRLLGTAKVAVHTAGSSKAEGVLEYVSLEEAHEIRASVRQLQSKIKDSTALKTESPVSLDESPLQPAAEPQSRPARPLFKMSTKRAFLSGAFHFSLLYIAGIFSLLQYIEPDPTILFSWLLRGPLDPWRLVIEESPIVAIIFGVVAAVFLGWSTGVLLTVNKNYGFSITLQDGKLHRRNGLMTLSEGTIPLKRIQSLIIRTNPIMLRFGFYRLEVQTMGIDVDEKGFQLAAPCARREEVEQMLAAINAPPFPTDWLPVSRLTIRRFAFRNSAMVLFILAGLYYFVPNAFPWAWSSLVLLPLILALSITRYKKMGYALGDNDIAIKSGIFRQYMWLIPIEKSQTFSLGATYFQRRLGLENLYVDTAGASPMAPAELFDIPSETGHSLLETLYGRFQKSAV